MSELDSVRQRVRENIQAGAAVSAEDARYLTRRFERMDAALAADPRSRDLVRAALGVAGMVEATDGLLLKELKEAAAIYMTRDEERREARGARIIIDEAVALGQPVPLDEMAKVLREMDVLLAPGRGSEDTDAMVRAALRVGSEPERPESYFRSLEKATREYRANATILMKR